LLKDIYFVFPFILNIFLNQDPVVPGNDGGGSTAAGKYGHGIVPAVVVHDVNVVVRRGRLALYGDDARARKKVVLYAVVVALDEGGRHCEGGRGGQRRGGRHVMHWHARVALDFHV
jgi:hypothetical protein